MNIRELMDKLHALENNLKEAEADDLAAYQRGKAAQGKLDDIEKVKRLSDVPLNQIPRLGDAIDPKTGIIYYGAAQGYDAWKGQATKYPFSWFQKTGDTSSNKLKTLLANAGLEVIPHEEKGLLGNTSVYAKVDPAKLAALRTDATDATGTDTTATDANVKDISGKIAQLRELLKQYSDANKQDGDSAVNTAPGTDSSVDTKPSELLGGNRFKMNIEAMQRELKQAGADLGTFGPAGDGIDGKIGKFTKTAMEKFPEIAKKYNYGGDPNQRPATNSNTPTAPVAATAPTNTVTPRLTPKAQPTVKPVELTADEKGKIDMAFANPTLAKSAVQAEYNKSTPEKRAAVKQYMDSKGYDAKKTFGIDFGAGTQPSTTQQAGVVSVNQDGSFSIVDKQGKKITFDKDGKILKEEQLSLAASLIESFGYDVTEEVSGYAQYGTAAGAGTAKAAIAKAGAKTVAKAIPGVGSTLSAIDAYNRWKAGDRSGAVISALAGIGWLVPGPVGWMIGGGLDAANLGRDLSKPDAPTSGVEPKPAAAPAAAPAQALPAGDIKTIALQKYLNSKGAKLQITGVMDEPTKAAMKAANLNESQKIELLRMQLDAIENPNTLLESIQLDEKGKAAVDLLKTAGGGVVDGAKVVGKKVSNFFKGTQSPNVTPLPNVGNAKNVKFKGPDTSFKLGQATGRNPVKSTVGVVGTGGTVGYLAGQDSDSGVDAKPADTAPDTNTAPPVNTVPEPVVTAPDTSGSGPDTSGPDADSTAPTGTVDLEALKKQIAALTGDIKGSGVKSPEADEVIKQAEEILQMTVQPAQAAPSLADRITQK